MNTKCNAIALTLVGATLATGTACARSIEGTSQGRVPSTLRFQHIFAGNGGRSIVSCGEQYDEGGSSYGVGFDPYPSSIPDETFTLGVVPSETDQLKDDVRVDTGATMRFMARGVVEVVTSDDKPGVSHIVDLSHAAFSAIVHGTNTYDVVLTIRKDTMRGSTDETAVMSYACLDHGNFSPQPTIPFPHGPGTITLSPSAPTPSPSPTLTN